MIKISEKLKQNLKKNGSPVIAVILFVAAFGITVLSLRSCTPAIDRYEVGKAVRSIVDGEKGDVVAEINGTEYYRQDLDLMHQMLRITEPEYSSLKENQQNSLAGEALIKQKLLLHEFDRLELTVTEEEFNEYLNRQKQDAFEKISLGNDESKSLTDYISGYGCTYSEYWEDAYVLRSYRDNIKIDKVGSYICIQKGGQSKVSAIYIQNYLADLIKDGTYKVTLFGEEFK